MNTVGAKLPSQGSHLILAPIRGVTDAVYREAFASCFGGLDAAVAPFLQLRQGHPLRASECRQVALDNPRAFNTIPQVLTNHAPTFLSALHELSDMGHQEVNWNLGCPQPTVAGRGRGAGLLPHPERIDSILGEVVSKAPVRLSVKMRLGYHDPDEFRAVMTVLNRYPLVRVILHSRTAAQMYGGEVDLIRAREAMELCRHPFVYNGDILTVDGFHELQGRLSGTSEWMIGRGVLKNPFLPILIKGGQLPAEDVRRPLLIKFHGLLFDGYGQWLSGSQHRLDRMREQWEYLAQMFADPASVYSRIKRCHVGNYQAVVGWIFDQAISDCGSERHVR